MPHGPGCAGCGADRGSRPDTPARRCAGAPRLVRKEVRRRGPRCTRSSSRRRVDSPEREPSPHPAQRGSPGRPPARHSTGRPKVFTDGKRPLLTTRRPRGRLRDVRYRGVLSAALVYDDLPVIDSFRAVDEDTVPRSDGRTRDGAAVPLAAAAGSARTRTRRPDARSPCRSGAERPRARADRRRELGEPRQVRVHRRRHPLAPPRSPTRSATVRAPTSRPPNTPGTLVAKSASRVIVAARGQRGGPSWSTSPSSRVGTERNRERAERGRAGSQYARSPRGSGPAARRRRPRPDARPAHAPPRPRRSGAWTPRTVVRRAGAVSRSRASSCARATSGRSSDTPATARCPRPAPASGSGIDVELGHGQPRPRAPRVPRSPRPCRLRPR